ncbi:MAG: hypothetical protein JW750_06630, partial [Anaerolineaceae bacterium]|nr:hypothetical protein [Anaerolineaceae bacterium]
NGVSTMGRGRLERARGLSHGILTGNHEPQARKGVVTIRAQRAFRQGRETTGLAPVVSSPFKFRAANSVIQQS